MNLKAWLLIVRIVNILASILMCVFEFWYVIDLFGSGAAFLTIIVRLFVPLFVILLAIVIVTSEFKYSKVVENFKFLQFVPGLALFYVFMASIFAFQFSTVNISWGSVMTACIFVGLAIIMGFLSCFRPAGTESLISAED